MPFLTFSSNSFRNSTEFWREQLIFPVRMPMMRQAVTWPSSSVFCGFMSSCFLFFWGGGGLGELFLPPLKVGEQLRKCEIAIAWAKDRKSRCCTWNSVRKENQFNSSIKASCLVTLEAHAGNPVRVTIQVRHSRSSSVLKNNAYMILLFFPPQPDLQINGSE